MAMILKMNNSRMCCLCIRGNHPISGRPVCEACYFETDENGVQTKPNFKAGKTKKHKLEVTASSKRGGDNMYMRIPFSRFGIPVWRVCATPQGALSITQLKVTYTSGEGRGPCLRCTQEHDHGYLVHFIGDDIGGPGVRFEFFFTGYLCPACADAVVEAMTL